MPSAWKPRIERPRTVLETILYPLAFYKARVAVRRIIGKPRTFEAWVMVDLFRAKGYLADSLPETVEAQGVTIPSRLDDQAAAKLARRTLLYYVLRRYRVGLAPDIEILETHKIYKIIWLTLDSGKKIIVDSVTGDTEQV